MNGSKFPLDKTDRHSTELGSRATQRPAVYRYVESPSVDGDGSQGYDSLLDYWHILLRHRKTLATCALAGLVAAILISLVQTSIYRVRTSLEFQGTSFLETKASADSSGSYATPESYMETQVKLLQSESLFEHVIDKLKLQQQPATGWRALTSRVRHIFESSEPPRLPEREKLIRQIESNLTVRTSGNSR